MTNGQRHPYKKQYKTSILHSRDSKRAVVEGSYMAIDPGLNGTGWSVWMPNRHIPVDVGVIPRRRADASWELGAMLIARYLRAEIKYHEVAKVYCEYPSFFPTVGGQMVARRGDLLKLTYLVGVIGGAIFPTKFILVPVNQWKGQLPKTVVEMRIRRFYNLHPEFLAKLHTHLWDSVGIGLHVRKERW